MTNKKVTKKKPKDKITNLAEYIAYAYSRKGQHLVLKPGVEKLICKSPKMDEMTRKRLLEIANVDILLAVPRQLMLTIQNIVGYPAVTKIMTEFIRDVLRRHPVFNMPELDGLLDNLDTAPEPRKALNIIASTNYSELSSFSKEGSLKEKDYKTLRINATYCMAVWFVKNNGISVDRISKYLYTALWEIEAKRIDNENDILRTITEVHDLAGIGLVSQRFKQRMDYSQKITDMAIRDKEAETASVQQLKEKVQELKSSIEDCVRQISDLTNTLKVERRDHQTTRMDWVDKFEGLRTRLLRKLKAEIELLDEGLHALRREPPKVRVMDDHAERALEGLKNEVKGLISDGQ